MYAPKAPCPSGQVFPTVSDSKRAYSMWVYRQNGNRRLGYFAIMRPFQARFGKEVN